MIVTEWTHPPTSAPMAHASRNRPRMARWRELIMVVLRRGGGRDQDDPTRNAFVTHDRTAALWCASIQSSTGWGAVPSNCRPEGELAHIDAHRHSLMRMMCAILAIGRLKRWRAERG